MAGSRVGDVVAAAVSALAADSKLTPLLGGAKCYTHVPQGTDPPYVVLMGGDEVPFGVTLLQDLGTFDDSGDSGGRQVDVWMFQMKFYAVALLRMRGVVPARLRLLYLADGQVLDYSPDLAELDSFEKTLMAIWQAIQKSGETDDFRPNPSKLCSWCTHQQLCPAFGGSPPPYPGWPENFGAA